MEVWVPTSESLENRARFWVQERDRVYRSVALAVVDPSPVASRGGR
jgi:hypothetical protein